MIALYWSTEDLTQCIQNSSWQRNRSAAYVLFSRSLLCELKVFFPSTGPGERLLLHLSSGILWEELWDHCHDLCRRSLLQWRHLCGDNDRRLHLPLPSQLHWLQLWEEAGPLQQQALSKWWVYGDILWLKYKSNNLGSSSVVKCDSQHFCMNALVANVIQLTLLL